jgi:hypothetical protein
MAVKNKPLSIFEKLSTINKVHGAQMSLVPKSLKK